MSKVLIELTEDEDKLVEVVRFIYHLNSKSAAVKEMIKYQKEHTEQLMKDYMAGKVLPEVREALEKLAKEVFPFTDETTDKIL